jgi:hypothetical protein
MLEKIDLQFQSCESFAFLKCGSVGDAHGCIGYVTKDTAMKYTHNVAGLKKRPVINFNYV